MRILRESLLLLFAVCLTAGGFFMLDTHGGKAERYIADSRKHHQMQTAHKVEQLGR